MANYTSLEQAQTALHTVNNTIDELVAKRSDAVAARSAANDKLNAYQIQMQELLAITEKNSFFSAEYMKATADANALVGPFSDAQRELAAARSNFNAANAAVAEAESEKSQIEKSIAQFETPGEVVTDIAATNSDTTIDDTAEKYKNSEIVGDTSPTDETADFGTDSIANTNPGAMPTVPSPAKVNVTAMSAKSRDVTDMRVKIRVPSNYLTALTSGPNGAGANDEFPVTPIKANGGIVFPYTPNISYSHKADYTQQTPLHSNFALNFYKNSSISSISIAGDFTVQNEKEAAVYIATVHLLRSLTKMRSGGALSGDPDSGSPPPVCRLDAYGSFMLDNVPVVITEFTVELPTNVDYFTLGKQDASLKALYGLTAVPVKSSIKVTCLPMYSRKEIQQFSVSSWLNNSAFRKGGYL